MSNFNLFFLLFIGLFLAIAVVFIILHLKNKALQAEQTGNDAAKQSAKEQEVYRFADAFETVNLLGKTPSQTGVNEKYFTEKGAWQVLPFDTLLFEKAAYGWVYFSGQAVQAQQAADTVFVNSKELTFEQCRAALTARYGEPASEWETPYVEVNGGAQSGCRFLWKGMKIELTSASERDYIELCFREK